MFRFRMQLRLVPTSSSTNGSFCLGSEGMRRKEGNALAPVMTMVVIMMMMLMMMITMAMMDSDSDEETTKNEQAIQNDQTSRAWSRDTDGKSKNEWCRIDKQELGKYKARGGGTTATSQRHDLVNLTVSGGLSSLCPSTRLRPWRLRHLCQWRSQSLLDHDPTLLQESPQARLPGETP
jgi:hypothetical protein